MSHMKDANKSKMVGNYVPLAKSVALNGLINLLE